MYRFNNITMLAPLFSVLPLSAWLMLVGSTLLGMVMKDTNPGRRSPALR